MGIASGVFAPSGPSHSSTETPAEAHMFLGCSGTCQLGTVPIGLAVALCIAAAAIAVSRWRDARRISG